MTGNPTALADELDSICDGYAFANSDTRTIRMAAATLRAAPVPQRDAEPVAWRHPLAMLVAQVESGNPISKDGEAMRCAKIALATPARCDAVIASACLTEVFGGERCIDKCHDPKDCSASPALPAGEDWERKRKAFHAALNKYPGSMEALHFFWNEGIAGAALSPSSNGKPATENEG